MNRKAHRFINQFQQISLTIDGKRKGFDIPAMWGHYADKGKGVCLVIDKEKFINSLEDNKNIIKHKKISYTNSFSPEIFYKSTKKDEFYFTDRCIKDIFFKKTTDWAYEQEYRVIAYAPEQKNRLSCNLGNSIVAIIIFESYNFRNGKDTYRSKLQSINEKIKVLYYTSFLDEKMIVDRERKTIWSTNKWESIKIDV